MKSNVLKQMESLRDTADKKEKEEEEKKREYSKTSFISPDDGLLKPKGCYVDFISY